MDATLFNVVDTMLLDGIVPMADELQFSWEELWEPTMSTPETQGTSDNTEIEALLLATSQTFENDNNQSTPATKMNSESVDKAINELLLAASQQSEQFLQNTDAAQERPLSSSSPIQTSHFGAPLSTIDIDQVIESRV